MKGRQGSPVRVYFILYTLYLIREGPTRLASACRQEAWRLTPRAARHGSQPSAIGQRRRTHTLGDDGARREQSDCRGHFLAGAVVGGQPIPSSRLYSSPSLNAPRADCWQRGVTVARPIPTAEWRGRQGRGRRGRRETGWRRWHSAVTY